MIYKILFRHISNRMWKSTVAAKKSAGNSPMEQRDILQASSGVRLASGLQGV